MDFLAKGRECRGVRNEQGARKSRYSDCWLVAGAVWYALEGLRRRLAGAILALVDARCNVRRHGTHIVDRDAMFLTVRIPGCVGVEL